MQYMLSSGHEHSFICGLSFNVITVLKKNNKTVHSHIVLLFFFVLVVFFCFIAFYDNIFLF